MIGFPGGVPALRTNLPLLKSASLVGVQLRHASLERPELLKEGRRRVAELAAQGLLTPAIAHAYPIEQYAEAMQAAAAGQSAGRIVLLMGPRGPGVTPRK